MSNSNNLTAGALRAARYIARESRQPQTPERELVFWAMHTDREACAAELLSVAKEIEAELSRAARNQTRPRISVLGPLHAHLLKAIAKTEGKA